MKEYEEIAQYCEKVGVFSAKIAFYGNTHTKVNENDRKKWGFKPIKHLATQSANQAQIATLEALYLLIKAIKDDEHLSDKEKFDLVWGELELCIIFCVRHFGKNYARNSEMPSIDIDDIRKRYNMNEIDKNIGGRYLDEQ